MKRILYICIGLVLSAVLLISCMKDFEPEPLEQNNTPAYLSIEDAQSFFESSFVDSSQSRSGEEGENDKGLTPSEFTPQWSKANGTFKQNTVASIETPIISSLRFLAIRAENKNGSSKAYTINTCQKLVVVKNKKTGGMSSYIMMYIPNIQNRKNTKFDRNNFSGVVLYCDVIAGLPLFVSEYSNGTRTRGVSMLSKSLTKKEKLERYNILLKDIVLVRSKAVTSRSGEDDWDWDGGWIDEVVVTPDEPIDGGWIDEVVVTPEDGFGDDDINWPGDSCFDGTCSCCGNEPTEPDPPYDACVEGTCSCCGGDEDTSESDENKVLIADIKQAAETVVADMTKQYGKKMAVCNFGVRDMFKALFNNSTELDNKKANEMTKYWKDNPSKWESIAIGDAQSLANAGWFVVAGWINPSGSSGHVSVVVPGSPTTGTWCGSSTSIPISMDVGYGNREESIGVNWCYGKDKQPNVKFYYYK